MISYAVSFSVALSSSFGQFGLPQEMKTMRMTMRMMKLKMKMRMKMKMKMKMEMKMKMKMEVQVRHILFILVNLF